MMTLSCFCLINPFFPDRLPYDSNEQSSAFMGNGDQGLLIRANDTSELSSLRFTLGRTTVYDDRQPGQPYTLNNFVVDRPRLPIGWFELVALGQTQTVGGDLWRFVRRCTSGVWCG
jgi:hypothetical protein